MNNPVSMIMHDFEMKLKSAMPYILQYSMYGIKYKYKQCVDAFYADYPDPKYYKRHGGEKTNYRPISDKGSSISYTVSSSGRYGTSLVKTYNITLNIVLEPSIMGSPYKDPTEYVFDRTWNQGIHGTLYVPQMGTPPTKMFQDYIDNDARRDLAAGLNKALLKVGLKGGLS